MSTKNTIPCHSERSRGIPLNQIIGDDTQRNSKIYLSSLGKYLKSKSASERDTSTPLSLRSVGQKFGFTLVELIVVITILVILGTIGFTSMQGFSSSARDSSRVSDLTNLQESLHLSYIKTGYYPTPSNFFGVTYSGATVWNQGTIGDSVITHLSSNGTKLSKKPTDSFYPNIEYTYSLLNTGKEFQIASIYEGTSIAFLPFGLPTAQATSQTYVTQIKGNYNGAVAKVSTGNTVYVLAVPSIILADTGTLDLNTLSATSSSNWVLNNKSNLPFSYKGADISLTGSVFSFAPTQPPAGSGLVVYANASLPTDNTGALALINALRSSYSGTTVQTEPSIKILFNSTLTQTELANLGKSLITTSLGGAAIALTQNTQTNTGSTGGSSSAPYIDDVFSTYLYTGNGGTQTINNGIDLAGKGGMVWVKSRSVGYTHFINDSARSIGNTLQSNTASANQATTTSTFGVTSFNADGFTVKDDGTGPGGVLSGQGGGLNWSPNTYVSWTFRKAPKFFTENTFTHTGGTADTIDLSTLGTVGMIVVKRTDSASNWYTWHKDLTTGNNLKLNLTDAQSTPNAYISVSGTNMTFSASAPSGTYVYYAWAHDPAPDGIIQAGTFTTDASGNGSLISLGWESQYLMFKNITTTGTDWMVEDNMRNGLLVQNGSESYLQLNTSNAEGGPANVGLSLNSIGFKLKGVNANSTYIYLAIRRPNKPPTSGDQVYNAVARTGLGATSSIITTDFSPDLIFNKQRTSAGYGSFLIDRLRGETKSFDISGGACGLNEISQTPDLYLSSYSNGFSTSLNGGNYFPTNTSGTTYVNHFFKRAPGVFDMVAYTGNGTNQAINHNLGVIPELMIVKARSDGQDWAVYNQTSGATKGMYLNAAVENFAINTFWNNTTPNTSNFTVGSASRTGWSGINYIAYLFASKPNISKVGSYTSDGTARTIDAGFSGNIQGARFVIIKRTDTTGDWYVFDSTRGIIASGNDPYILLNKTDAEVTNTNYIEPNSAGFGLNANTPINTSGGSYIYLAIH